MSEVVGVSESCASGLLLSLPDDILAIVSRGLSPRDICNLSLCCRNLCALMASEKIWFTQCEMLGVLSARDLVDWREGVASYRAVCRFLVSVQELVGIWVHQNPELGNVVYVMPGFISVVGCRIIPQELSPLGIEDGAILWAPVFEIIGDFDGSSKFFLHGREIGYDYVYPGSVKSVERNCNVLLLEVEPQREKNGRKLQQSKSFANCSENEKSEKVFRSNGSISRAQRVAAQNAAEVPFGRLAFGDRRRLLETVTSQVRVNVPTSARELLFPGTRDDLENFRKDIVLLMKRRSLLLHLYKLGGGCSESNKTIDSVMNANPTQLDLSEVRKNLDRCNSFCNPNTGDDGHRQCAGRKSFSRYFRSSFKHILSKSRSISSSRGGSKSSYSSSESRHAQFHEFLESGDSIGLSLRASTVKLSSYRAWPIMHDSRFALYKLPIRAPTADQEYAGLWGGTFGWPPGRPSEDKPGKALFFLLLSYEESEGQQLLIATKILEGTHYVLHPNGSAMFSVNTDEPSVDPFPWDVDADSRPVNIQHAYAGEGIANGYGFRYPGAKPGSLFVTENGLLSFVWKESKAVLTLQRLDLEELLKKGERIPALPPIANFSYLTKSYSNVFAGFSNVSASYPSPRFVPSTAIFFMLLDAISVDH